MTAYLTRCKSQFNFWIDYSSADGTRVLALGDPVTDARLVEYVLFIAGKFSHYIVISVLCETNWTLFICLVLSEHKWLVLYLGQRTQDVLRCRSFISTFKVSRRRNVAHKEKNYQQKSYFENHHDQEKGHEHHKCSVLVTTAICIFWKIKNGSVNLPWVLSQFFKPDHDPHSPLLLPSISLPI